MKSLIVCDGYCFCFRDVVLVGMDMVIVSFEKEWVGIGIKGYSFENERGFYYLHFSLRGIDCSRLSKLLCSHFVHECPLDHRIIDPSPRHAMPFATIMPDTPPIIQIQ